MIYDVLPMYQPWASGIFTINPDTGFPFKRIETRSQNTTKRRTVLIHACSSEKAFKKLRYDEPFVQVINYRALPFGAIIGAVDIIDCGNIIEIPKGFPEIRELSKDTFGTTHLIVYPPESDLGDYREGRYGWILKNPRLLIKPIPFKASQGWNKYTADQTLEFKDHLNTI
jgi:hypothetical protein